MHITITLESASNFKHPYKKPIMNHSTQKVKGKSHFFSVWLQY